MLAKGEPETLSSFDIKRSNSLVINRTLCDSSLSDLEIRTSTPKEESLQITMSKDLLSNSTVSLASVQLNPEIAKDINTSSDKTEIRQRIQKPLDHIDRYTMCSNRIV